MLTVDAKPFISSSVNSWRNDSTFCIRSSEIFIFCQKLHLLAFILFKFHVNTIYVSDGSIFTDFLFASIADILLSLGVTTWHIRHNFRSLLFYKLYFGIPVPVNQVYNCHIPYIYVKLKIYTIYSQNAHFSIKPWWQVAGFHSKYITNMQD